MTNQYLYVLFGWNLIITLLLLYLWFLLRRILPPKSRGIKQTIEESIVKSQNTQKSLNELKQTLEKNQEKGRAHFQKAGLVRFNPFERLGGEQSYSIALLNDLESGLVITFLYTREGIRVYAKEVVSGKGKEIELSQEEKAAIIKATKL